MRRLPYRRRRPAGAARELVRLSLLAAALMVLWMVLRLRAPEPMIAVWDPHAGRVVELGLEDYVRGVVAAEMPADFHLEALKAQAVAARTYALRRVERDERLPDQPAAHVSTDFARHQAWTSAAAFLARWGTWDGLRRWARVTLAVEATRGMVLTHNGELIEALYHSTSGGHTEDAHRYFSGGQPYLVGVPDPWGDHSPFHQSAARFPLDTVLARLGLGEGGAAAPGPVGVGGTGSTGASPSLDRPTGTVPIVVEVLSRTPAGRAETVAVAGRVFTGRQVREALGLRSSWFDVEVNGGDAVFHVRGSGHGVGMAQYGADGMARAGFGYAEILAYYYQGATVEKRY
ncbi:MAG TPA: stage II sporulation protein D [Limnochordales bacterium]